MKANEQLQFRLVRKEGKNNSPLIPIYIKIIKEIFINCLSNDELEVIFEKNLKNELYVVFYHTQPIGITGLYWGDEDNICWFNWFGILPSYRNIHFGTKILLETFAIAKKRFRGIRLYTDDGCEIAVKYLYSKYFDFNERLDNVIIFSKSFDEKQLDTYNKPAYGLEANTVV